MLVSYTGWGYYEYEVDTDVINYTSEEIRQGLKRLHSGTSGCYLRAENIIFELPIPAQRNITLLRKATVEYLLFSEFTFFDEVDLRFNLPPKNDGRFWLCEDKPIYDDYGQVVHCERKKVTYELKDVTRIEDVLKAKDQTEKKPISSVSDRQGIVIDTPQKQTIKRNRGQTQITIFLTELCQKQDIDSLSAKSLVSAIRPLVGTINCPAKRYHGFYDDVAIEWNPRTGSRQGSWGKKTFQNFVSAFKKNNPKKPVKGII